MLSLRRKDVDDGEISKACQGVVELASEKMYANLVQIKLTLSAKLEMNTL